jgi:hypothetical protein
MGPGLWRCGGLCGACLWLGSAAWGQAAPEVSVAGVLSSLSARAGDVFAGQVVSVRPVGGVVEVQFRVEQTLKGQAAGSVVLREWAGLWAAGQRRYWVGERAVVFLHEAGKSGLRSAVDGMEGVLPISQTDALAAATVDVGRLRTAVQREVGAPMVKASESKPDSMSLTEVAVVVQGGPAIPILPPDSGPERFPVPVHGGPVIAQVPVSVEPVQERRPSLRRRPIKAVKAVNEIF